VGAARYPAAPTCYIDTFGDHGVHLRLRYWIREPYKLLAAKSRVQTNVWSRLEDADVEIAYPHQHVVFDETSGEMQVGVADRPSGQRPPRDPPTDDRPADDRPGRPDRGPSETDGDGDGDG
jgi:small-conductance mechanosensitive channel